MKDEKRQRGFILHPSAFILYSVFPHLAQNLSPTAARVPHDGQRTPRSDAPHLAQKTSPAA